MRQLSFIDLFGAPGGMSMGFKLAGMNPIGVVDIFQEGIDTYRANFSKVPSENIICADASKNDIIERFRTESSLKPGDIDVIIGGPPCQGFSIMGRSMMASLVKNGRRNGTGKNARFVDDPRNSLYKSFVRFVAFFKPRAIVMENVVGMISYKDGMVIEQIKEDFENVGYSDVDYRVLNAADYGVPQRRRRIFFVATRDNTGFAWPEATHFSEDDIDKECQSPRVKKHVSVWDAIGDLPRMNIPTRNSKSRDSVRRYETRPMCDFQKWSRGNLQESHNNITRWHRQKDIEVFENMDPGSWWSHLSASDRKKIGYSSDSFNDKWKRLPIDRPSWTVLSHLSKDGYAYIHPRENRTISVREAARLQSFPDRFVFSGSRSSQFKQIGNAVPPLLASAIAKSIKKSLK